MSENSPISQQLSIWWQQTIQGDQDAFGFIHKELFNSLYYYALKLLDDQSLANDALQELFIKLWTSRNKIGQLHNVKAYFFVSLRRQILNQIRNNKINGKQKYFQEEFYIEFSPEEVIIKNQEKQSLHDKLMALLNDLPDRQKEAIYLHFFEELNYSQIAEIMKINYQSVLNLIQKALQKLRENDLLLIFLFSFLSPHF